MCTDGYIFCVGLQDSILVARADRKVQLASLHVSTANSPALTLYSKAGFRQDGDVHQDYYAPGKHAVKMIKDLQGLTGE